MKNLTNSRRNRVHSWGGDGCCLIQNCKPDVCVEFPYADKPGRLSSMYGVIERAEVCPVVFEILERLKDTYGFRKTL